VTAGAVLPQKVVIRLPEDAETISLLGGLYRYRGLGDDTARLYSLFEVTGDAGLAAPRHVHDEEAEAFYVVDGQVTLFHGDVEVEAPAGTFAVVPREVPHSFRFEAPGTRLLLMTSPGNAGHEALFRELGEPVSSGNGRSSAAPAAPDFAKLAETAARHGTRIVGPPPGPRA
jgi:quercetin dioxygenase-like cupin family protein